MYVEHANYKREQNIKQATTTTTNIAKKNAFAEYDE